MFHLNTVGLTLDSGKKKAVGLGTDRTIIASFSPLQLILAFMVGFPTR
jgi:hypothetical protein